MANTTIGGILIRIGASTKELEYDLKRAEKALQKTASKFSGLGNRLSVGLTLPIAAAGAASFKMASDFEESLNKVRVAFGSSSESVEQFASTTLKNFGIARGSALDMAALFGDMATSMGLPQDEAAKLSTSLVSLAGDLASFKNINISEAQTALSGVFTGETESLKRLGIVMLETNLNAFALTQGINKQVKEMTQAEKVALRYSYIMDVTKNAQGDFARTSGGAANQMRIFQESIKELGASFGNILLPILTPIISRINQAVQAFGSLSEETKKTILVIAGIAAAIGPVLIVVGQLISSYGAVIGAMKTLIATSPALATALTTGLGPISVAIAAIAAGVYLIYDNWDLVVNKINEVYKESILFRTVVESIKFVVKSIYDIFVAFVKTIGVAASTADGLFEALLGKGSAKEVLKKSFNELKDINKEVSKNIGDNFVDGITSAIGNKSPAIKKALVKAAQISPSSAATPFAGVSSISGGSGTGGEERSAKVPLIGALGTSKGIITDLETSIGAMQQRLTGGISTATTTLETLLDNSKNSVRDWAVSTGQGFVTATGEFKNFTGQFVEINGKLEEADGYFKKFGDNVKITAKQIGDVVKYNITDNITGMSKTVFDVGELVKNTLQSLAVEGFAEFGNFIGNIITGDTGALQGFFKNILLIIADFGAALGKQLIALGVASDGFKKMFSNPVTAIAAGIGLIAISKIIKNTVSKGVPKLAIGTDYVKQDGLAYLHKGEKVVPANVVKGGYTGSGGKQEIYGTLRGTDLFLSNKYSGNNYNRFK